MPSGGAMKVSDIMSKEVVSVKPDDTLSSLVRKFIRHNYHTFPVVEKMDNRKVLVGTVDYEDMMKVFIPHNPALAELLKASHLYLAEEEDLLAADITSETGTTVKVADIMSRNLVAVDEDAGISYARIVMKQHNTERLAVTSEGALSGFVTLFDIIVAVFREKGVIK